MSTNGTTGNESPVTAADSTADAIETFVTTVTDALSDVGADDGTVASVKDAGQQLVENVGEMEQEVESLRDDLHDTRKEQAEIRSDVHELGEAVKSAGDAGTTDEEPGSDDETSAPDTDETATNDPVTALGDCITIPEPLADDSLSANQNRARDVAADVVDYGRSVPAGYAITSSELRTVLTALKDGEGRTYTETVGRVIDYLDDLGGDAVKVKETMGGQRTVVFSDEFVKRTVAWRNRSEGNPVVTDERVAG